MKIKYMLYILCLEYATSVQVISNTAKFSNSEYKYLILRIERTSNKLQYLLVQWRVPTFAIICQVFSERNYNWLSPYCRSSIHKSFAFKPNKQRHEWVTYKLKLLIICKKLLLREVSKYGVFSGPYYPTLDWIQRFTE